MFFVLSGGGTAGHVTPAIAIAEALIKKYPDSEILFIGRNGGKENDLISKAGFNLKTIEIYGLKRSFSAENIRAIKATVSSFRESKRILTEVKADMVIGTGGYVCFPVLKAAMRLGIPTVLHESNSTLGLSSKLLSRGCDALCLAYEKNAKTKNALFVGNPLRESFKKIPKENAKAILGIPRNSFFLVSVGGSGGAEKLNEASIDLMKSFSAPKNDVYHLHSCGRSYYGDISKRYPELCANGKRYKTVPFIENMATVLSAADTVITRCGAMTLAEISYCRAAPILIPSPNVTGNHQLKNAEAFSEKSGATIIEEKDLSHDTLFKAVKQYYEDPNLMRAIANRSADANSDEAKIKILKIIDDILCKKEG